jgi:aminopeptidase N
VITYKVEKNAKAMQIDLQHPMKIDKVLQGGKELNVRHENKAHFIQLTEEQHKGEKKEITVYFSGVPHKAENAPWDGGWTWTKDERGKEFIATSNQGIGASLWWPCKDHMYDEPDNGIALSINVPKDLVGVGNGRLKEVIKEKNKTKTYVWNVVNPINNYGVNVNVGDYVSFGEKYAGEKGELDMDYWVLSYNLQKAKVHFADARRTIEAFEYWFGPYPFYEDSYKLVETPYLGMEHQSSVTYGNGYQNGYKGRDLSDTGWGLKWDYIIVHESGHEWFANNITYRDVADMWVHESFTMYAESLFIEYYYGKAAAAEYTKGLRMSIDNRQTLIGDYDVNAAGSKDMYNKGNNMLHTLRQWVNDDEKWRATLRGLNKTFYHSVVTTKQIEDYMAKKLNLNLKGFFDQYLRDYRIPVLEYRIKDKSMFVRWTNCIETFDMPVRIKVGETEQRIYPTQEVKEKKLTEEVTDIYVDTNFYIYSDNTMK